MIKPKFFCILLTTLLFVPSVFAQQVSKQEADPSYEVVLRILKSSAAKTSFPADLSPVVKELEERYNFGGYRLISNHLHRVGIRGNVHYRSLLDELNPSGPGKVKSQWKFRRLQSLTGSNGREYVSFQHFSFEAGIPLPSGLRESSGRDLEPVIIAEVINLALENFSIPVGDPTLIGTLDMPKSDDVLFFVLTVKSP